MRALLIERAAPGTVPLDRGVKFPAEADKGDPDDKAIHGLKPSSILTPAQVKTLTNPAPAAPPTKPAGFGLFGF